MMTRTRTRTAILVAGAAASLITLSACSGAGYGGSAAPANQPQSANGAVGPAGGVKLTAAPVGNLGQVVTDQNGLTLYRFDKDKAKPSVSNCNDACATTWPPALGDPASVQLDGVDQALVGAVAREDGTQQLTLNGWPLYTYAKDTTAGEAKGQGVGKTWFAVTPQGKKAKAVSSSSQVSGTGSSSSGSSSSDSGYGSSGSSSGGYGSGGY